ncbi:hypothetical protein ACFYY3_15985 [Streptomyces sp. NPDC001812]|uniref:hypothetical protein n=1 Tax=Streptomyces sp. NPDC001812 TaxID=3364611 RepID=UPI00368274F7
MTDNHQNIADGLTPENRARVIQSRADNYQHNPQYEQLLARIDKDPTYGDTITPTLRLALATYENDKAAHEDLND